MTTSKRQLGLKLRSPVPRSYTRTVGCPECGVGPGERCLRARARRDGSRDRASNHAERVQRYRILAGIAR
jgi:hypothetical protein